MSRLTSSFTCQLISIIITTLIIHHSFSLSLHPTFSTNPSHLRLVLPTVSRQRDWTGPIMLIVLFLVSHFNFLFVPCSGLSWLAVCFLLHVKYTLSASSLSVFRKKLKPHLFHPLSGRYFVVCYGFFCRHRGP